MTAPSQMRPQPEGWWRSKADNKALQFEWDTRLRRRGQGDSAGKSEGKQLSSFHLHKQRFDMNSPQCSQRSWRYSVYVKVQLIQKLFVEPAFRGDPPV